jgi:hypothetical protein
MPRPANEVMQSVIFSAVLDAVQALKNASGGLPNQLLRDVQAIHPNVTFADLPKQLQDAIVESTRSAFTQLLKEGYAVGPRQQMQQSRPLDRVPERDRRAPPRIEGRDVPMAGDPAVRLAVLTERDPEVRPVPRRKPKGKPRLS